MRLDLFDARRSLRLKRVARSLALYMSCRLRSWPLTYVLAGAHDADRGHIALSLLIVAPIGPYPLSHRLSAAGRSLHAGAADRGRRRHFAMTGLGLVFFGPEGLRGPALSTAASRSGRCRSPARASPSTSPTIALMVALYLFFGRTLLGKALRATAVNRLGARLVGVRTALSGQLAFLIAAAIGALSGVLIVPITTVYYDSGFLIGLKGFVAAIVGGLVSYPLAAVAALFVGIVEAFASFWACSFKEIIVFMLIIPVLVLRSLAAPAVEDEED